MNLFGMLSSWGSSNYRPSAPFLYEVASHVKNCHFGDYYYGRVVQTTDYGRRCCMTQTWEPQCVCAPMCNTLRRVHIVLGRKKEINPKPKSLTQNNGLGIGQSLALVWVLPLTLLEYVCNHCNRCKPCY